MTFCFIKILFHLLALLSTFKMHKAERLLAQELCTVSLVQVILQVPSPQTCQSAYSHIWKSGVSPHYFRGPETVDQTVTRKTSTGHHNQKHSKKVFPFRFSMGLQLERWRESFGLKWDHQQLCFRMARSRSKCLPRKWFGFAQDKSLEGSSFSFFCFLKWALLLMPYL